MASHRRVEQVQNLLREVAAGIVSRDVSFPPGAMVTVTRSVVSEDLLHATLYVSVFSADPGDERVVLDELARSTGAIQNAINRALAMRPVPRITFAIDQDERRRERIEKLLAEQPPQD